MWILINPSRDFLLVPTTVLWQLQSMEQRDTKNTIMSREVNWFERLIRKPSRKFFSPTNIPKCCDRFVSIGVRLKRLSTLLQAKQRRRYPLISRRDRLPPSVPIFRTIERSPSLVAKQQAREDKTSRDILRATEKFDADVYFLGRFPM